MEVNIVRKQENAVYQHFLFSLQYFLHKLFIIVIEIQGRFGKSEIHIIIFSSFNRNLDPVMNIDMKRWLLNVSRHSRTLAML